MIVLDEQLLAPEIGKAIRSWYKGQVIGITQLRPGTLIKDDSVAFLLRKARWPIFVTINVADFWRRMKPDPHFTVACFDFSHEKAAVIPKLLRRLLQLKPFQTRSKRLGKIVHVSQHQVRYYTTESWTVEVLDWPKRK
jgi:hypothetical protein